ncbi:MAG TPA: hypothetical protein VK054_08470, partial [Beutenbergiaceae bacterium]|nr:hypothetical protein [Beutenbergiaceae bacterium]
KYGGQHPVTVASQRQGPSPGSARLTLEARQAGTELDIAPQSKPHAKHQWPAPPGGPHALGTHALPE